MSKELRHIVRDWQTLTIILVMPVMMMFLYGYALNMDLNELPVLVEDPVPSEESRALIAAINATALFDVIGAVRATDDPEHLFRMHRMRALFRFSPDFARELQNGGTPAQIQVLIDGSDPNVGTILKNTIEPMLTNAALAILRLTRPEVIRVDQRILYNQEQKSALYFVPGLMAIILLMISALLTSLAITREKELGTMEQILVSPVRPLEIVIGKILPYVILAGIDSVLILGVGRLNFGVAIAGNPWLLALGTVIYIFTALAIGLLISTIARTQQQAMMIVLPVTLLPTIILSGFIFPLASLPYLLRLITYIVPATYFLEIIRGIILKGIGISIIWKPMLVLLAISFVLVGISIRKMRVKL